MTRAAIEAAAKTHGVAVVAALTPVAGAVTWIAYYNPYYPGLLAAMLAPQWGEGLRALQVVITGATRVVPLAEVHPPRSVTECEFMVLVGPKALW